ncbi:competence type IV pilus assembly protein ComGB [Bacillus gobiensis]|uniref:competence type IV pilus assembly protein ComGB n=1 Tax=Bacillus gobiensis TaxID=1441095 RepID=UPI003D19014D
MKWNNSKWSINDQAFFLKRTGEMIEKGYTLLEALSFIYLQLNPHQQKHIDEGIKQLTTGDPFYKVLETIGFQRDVISIHYFAEQHGNLSFALKQSGDLLYRRVSQAEKFKRVAKYPLFLIFVVAIMLYIIQAVIVPQFSSIYQSMNLDTSFGITFLFAFFSSLKYVLLLFTLLIAYCVVYYFIVFRHRTPSAKMALLIKLPFWGKQILLLNSYFFSLQLSNLLKSGLSIYDSLKAFRDQSFLPFYQEEAETFIQRLKHGEDIGQLLKDHPYYEKDLSKVVKHGQINGQLDRELFTYSQFLLERLERKAEKWSSILQPAIYGFVGFMIVVVYLSMLLPMYHMMNEL